MVTYLISSRIIFLGLDVYPLRHLCILCKTIIIFHMRYIFIFKKSLNTLLIKHSTSQHFCFTINDTAYLKTIFCSFTCYCSHDETSLINSSQTYISEIKTLDNRKWFVSKWVPSPRSVDISVSGKEVVENPQCRLQITVHYICKWKTNTNSLSIPYTFPNGKARKCASILHPMALK